jgi:transcriptional regulator with XRE-family HTH domain
MRMPLLLARSELRVFATELRAARLHAGLSVSEVARRAKMSRQGLLKIERTGSATLLSVILLASAIGCQVSDFFPRKAPWRL